MIAAGAATRLQGAGLGVTLTNMAELPRGAVTFLFTDIEGSTQLVKQLRGRYSDVLGEHQRLLREAFAKHDGHEIDTQGDAFFVAFASAREAVLAAVEAQRAISRYPWPDSAPVRVRMGIHTGQALPVDGRYTGLAVHRAARICAAGHGGQVLVSQATHTLLEDEEEDLSVAFRDLGEQQLKDLDRPVHLYQLAAPGLPEAFAPPRRDADATTAAPGRRRLSPWLLVGLGVLGVLIVVPVVALLASRGGDGGLSGVEANNVGVIDPATNEITRQVFVGRRPGPIAVGRGAVWVGLMEDRTLSRVKSTGEASPALVNLHDQTPTGVAVGPGGVWVAHGFLGTLSRVDPQFNQLTKTINVAARSTDGNVTVGGGSVWAVYGESTLAKINPAAIRVVGKGFAGNQPAGIAFGRGAVWVANSGEATVDQFNPGTFEEGAVWNASVGPSPRGIAFGEGAVWVANRADDTVTRIDPDSRTTRTIEVGDAPSAIAVGAGAVWVANTGDGTITRIDPTTREVAKTIHAGNAPSGIAYGDGSVWVTVQAP
jgi:YVTN family beta-propeller protein